MTDPKPDSGTQNDHADLPDGPTPEVFQGVLDEDALARYFSDLEEAAEIFEVRVKGPPTQYANQRALEFSTAREIFGRGLVRGLQIRYVHDNQEWWDTLIRVNQQVRLVRITHDS